MCTKTIKGLKGLGIEENSARSISDQLIHNNRVEIIVLKTALRADVLAGNGRFMNYSVTLDGEANEAGYINLVIERPAS